MAERLNKRNLHYNNRHRNWDPELSAMDVDFMEYDSKTGKPLALLETKFGRVKEIDLNEPAFDALCMLAREEIPVFCLVYYPLDAMGQLVDADQPTSAVESIQFVVAPVNRCARQYVPSRKRMTEVDWVKILRQLHGLTGEINDPTLCSTWRDVQIPQIMFRP